MKTLLKLTITTLTLIALTACGSSGGGKGSKHGLIEEAPVAKSQTLQTKSDSSISITLQATDANGDSLTYRITTPPKHGKLTGTPPQVSYTPDRGYTGDDSFGFVANDGQADSAEVTVTLHIVSNDGNGSDDHGSNGGNGSDGQNGGGDGNTTTGGDDNGTTGGSDNNGTTIGGDDNSTTGGDSNGTTGGSDDNGTTGGNDGNTTTLQTLTLSIADTTLNKDHNTTLTLTATYSDGKIKPVTSGIEWIATPSDAVTIHGNTLTALKDTNVTLQAKVGNKLSNPVNLSVYWEVNGHRLPPEPDPKINNSTLLGIDVNKNGVRDDVERWIYETYDEYIPCHQESDGNYTLPSGRVIPLAKTVCEDHPVPYHPVVRAVAMQGARAAQIIIQHPEKAQETLPVWEKAIDCDIDISLKYKNILPKSTIDKKFDAIQFNTVQRARAYAKFNFYLSGGVYEDKAEELYGCDADVQKYLKDLK